MMKSLILSLIFYSLIQAQGFTTLGLLMDSNAFFPPDVNGLVMWFRGDEGLTTSGWADKSGNGNNMTLYNSPTINSSGLNGHKTVSFNGSTQYGRTGTFTLEQPFTVIIVFKAPATYENDRCIFSSYGGLESLYSNGGANLWKTFAGTFINNQDALYLENDTWVITMSDFNDASSRHSKNDSTIIPMSCGAGDFNGITVAKFGGANLYVAISVAEIIVYDNSISEENYALILTYLNSRYAIY